MPVLLCDLDDTLFDHDRATRDALTALRTRHAMLTGWSLDELDARHRVWLEHFHLEVLAGRLTVDEARVERFARLLEEAEAGDRHVAAVVAQDYRDEYFIQWHPVPGAIELLRAVRADGHSVVIVTNNGVAEQRLKLARCGFDAHVDGMVTSEEAGISKPAPEIFARALSSVSARAEDAVMLGDAWIADVEGARGAGITPVWLNRTGRPSPDTSVAELRALDPTEPTVSVLRDAGLRRPR